MQILVLAGSKKYTCDVEVGATKEKSYAMKVLLVGLVDSKQNEDAHDAAG